MVSFSFGKIFYFSILRWNAWKPILRWNNNKKKAYFYHNSDIFFLRIASLHLTVQTFFVQMIKFWVYTSQFYLFYLIFCLFCLYIEILALNLRVLTFLRIASLYLTIQQVYIKQFSLFSCVSDFFCNSEFCKEI